MVVLSRATISALLTFQSFSNAVETKWFFEKVGEISDRNLQSESCNGEDVVLRLYGRFDVVKPTFFSDCASSLSINAENMKLHIQSLMEIFQQYHCFHDIARDPKASTPSSFQPELGNSIYAEGGGQVDIEAELSGILRDIEDKGASMATFWEINAVFNKLFDGHVGLPRVEQDFYGYNSAIFPERFADDDTFTLGSIFPDFYLDDNSILQLTVLTEETTGEVVARDVDTINEQSVAGFLSYLANSPELNIAYQDLGARVNVLVQVGALFFGVAGSGTPSKMLPDSFEVTYKDGTSEKYLFGIVPSGPFYSWTVSDAPGSLFVDRDAAEFFINQAGEQYDAWQRATARISDLTRLRGFPMPDEEILRPNLGKRSISPRQFDEPLFNETFPGIAGYFVQDDYIVLKLSSFLLDFVDTTSLWSVIVAVAEENGIKKVMIDTSGNGGGSILDGYRLLFMMFPSADLDWFVEQWDTNYNEPMRRYLEALEPVLGIIREEVVFLSDQVLLNRIESLTEEDFEIYDIAAAGLLELCNDAVNPLDFEGAGTESQCLQAAYLQSNVTAFVSSRDLVTYVELLSSLLDTAQHYNPWSVVLEQIALFNSDITDELVSAGVQTFIRGGVESNFTAKFNILGDLLEFVYDDTKLLNAALNYTFEEYLFVSDGVSGSMAAILPFEASQLYKNRDRSKVQTRVTLAAYGGTGNAEDFTVASFPASIQGVHLEDPIIGDASLQLLVNLLPSNLTSLTAVMDTLSEYSETIVVPPFFGDTLPLMPVVSFYNIFMEPGALPLQYVKIPLDEYIPTLYTSVSFEDPSDLPFLYQEASNFFTRVVEPAPARSPTEMPAIPTTLPPEALSEPPSPMPSPLSSASPTVVISTTPTGPAEPAPARSPTEMPVISPTNPPESLSEPPSWMPSPLLSASPTMLAPTKSPTVMPFIPPTLPPEAVSESPSLMPSPLISVAPTEDTSSSPTEPEFNFVVSNVLADQDWCLTATDTTGNAVLGLSLCDYDNTPSNQQWQYKDGQFISKLDENRCMKAGFGNRVFPGVRIRLGTCNDRRTTFIYRPESRTITPTASSRLCVASGGTDPNVDDTIHALFCSESGEYLWDLKISP